MRSQKVNPKIIQADGPLPSLPGPNPYKILGVNDGALRALWVACLALPPNRRLVRVHMYQGKEIVDETGNRLLGYFRRIGPNAAEIGLSKDKDDLPLRSNTLVHEAAHLLDWGVAPNRGKDHNLGFGDAYSLMYRVYIGEVTTIRLDGRGTIYWVEGTGAVRVAKAK